MVEQRTPDINKEGRWLIALLSVWVALGYGTASGAAALMPAELQADPDISPHEFWLVLAKSPHAHLGMHVAFAVAGLSGVGLIAVMLFRLRTHLTPSFVVASAFGMVGFAILARSHLMELEFDLRVLPIYASGTPSFQQSVHVVAGLALDVPHGVLTLGTLGAWMIAASATMRNAMNASRLFQLTGLTAGIALFVGVLGYSLQWQSGIVASFAIGHLLAGPLWHMWLAVLFVRKST